MTGTLWDKQISPCYSDRHCGPLSLLSNGRQAFFPEGFVGIFTGLIYSCFTERWWQHLTWRLMTEQLAGKVTKTQLRKPMFEPKVEPETSRRQVKSGTVQFTGAKAVDAPQSTSSILKLAGRGSGKRWKERGARDKRLMPALWHEMPAESTSHNISDTSTRCWA